MSMEWINRTKPLTKREKRLLEKNRGLIADVIRRDFRSYIRKVEAIGGEPGRRYEELFTYGDLFGAGCFGIIIAAESWDPTKGPWPMYCEIWIKNRIHLFIDKCWERMRLPRNVKQAKRWEQLSAEAQAKHEKRYGTKRHGLTNEERERYRLAKDIRPIEVAAGQPIRDQRDRTTTRKETLQVLYSVRARTDEERLGRIIALKLASLDGGCGSIDNPDILAEVAAAAGTTPTPARNAYEKFLHRIRGELWLRGKMKRTDSGN